MSAPGRDTFASSAASPRAPSGRRDWLKPMLFLPVMLAPLALHVAVVTGEGVWLALALGTAQLLLGAAAMRGGSLGRWPLIAVLAAPVLALGLLAGQEATAWLLLLSGASHAVIFGTLLLTFVLSLRPGRDDLVTALARRLDPGWTPAMRDYTRGVTKAWSLFFAGQIAASAALFVLAPRGVWSFFVNVLDLPLIGAMFLAEYAWRKHRYPGRAHVGPRRIVAALRAGGPG